MSVLADSVYAIIAIQIKKRHDSLTDQYHRLLMVKMCILCSLVIGINFFSDKVTCIISESYEDDEDEQYAEFVGAACWVQGFYVFEEMKNRLHESSYYGIPDNVNHDGVTSDGFLCSTTYMYGTRKSCTPMSKLYFLQFQYMPFYTASLAFVFYIPYIIYKLTNFDMSNLRDAMKREGETPHDLYHGFFVSQINSRTHMRQRFIVNFLVKVLYLMANIVAFLTTDILLHRNFVSYGIDYAFWVNEGNHTKHDPDMGVRKVLKPANVLLPPMAFCDIHEITSDSHHSYINSHRYLCEISQHILYQYVLLLLWILLVLGMVVAVIGMFEHLFVCCKRCICLHQRGHGHVFPCLTFREIEYLDYIFHKDKQGYNDVIKMLCRTRGVVVKHFERESVISSVSSHEQQQQQLQLEHHEQCQNTLI